MAKITVTQKVSVDEISYLLENFRSIIDNHEALKKSVKSLMGFYKVSYTDLADALGIGVSGLQYKLKKPDAFTTSELTKVWEFFESKSKS